MKKKTHKTSFHREHVEKKTEKLHMYIFSVKMTDYSSDKPLSTDRNTWGTFVGKKYIFNSGCVYVF